MIRRTGCRGAALLLAILAGCVSGPGDGPPSRAPETLPEDPVPRREPLSRYGNGPFYEVYGKRYQVLPTSDGYRAQGVASWYGEKFHGRPTSSQEPYDMHALTAAHKTLPLPTYVRVRNLRNDRSVIVRVNDRGPFVDNRIIDLSYAAARRLDMIGDGTSLVEVEAIGIAEVPEPQRPPEAAVTEVSAALDTTIYVQVGAFGDIANAERRHAQLEAGGIEGAFLHEDPSSSPSLYRVRIGPIADVTEYDTIVERLQRLGISETHLVSEQPAAP